MRGAQMSNFRSNSRIGIDFRGSLWFRILAITAGVCFSAVGASAQPASCSVAPVSETNLGPGPNVTIIIFNLLGEPGATCDVWLEISTDGNSFARTEHVGGATGRWRVQNNLRITWERAAERAQLAGARLLYRVRALPIDAPNPPSRITVPRLPEPQRVESPTITLREGRSRWGLTSSAVVGRAPEPTKAWLGIAAGKDVTLVEGFSFDFGLSFRSKPRSSFWRFTAALETVDEGSLTRYFCECGNQVSTVSNGWTAWAPRVERIQKLFTIRPIQPVLSLRLGAFMVRGMAYEYAGPVGGLPTSAKQTDTRDLLESSFLVDAGLGLGIATELGRHLTLTPLIGVEFPRGPFFEVGLTFWR